MIRNSFIIDEGDPFNELLFEKSIQNLKSKNIFKQVNYKVNESLNTNKII